MTERVYSSAVVGLGNIGMLAEADPKRLKPASHVGMHLGSSRVRLIGLVEIDAEKRRYAEERWKIPVFASIEELFKKEIPDILSVATANEAHVPVVLTAAAAKVPAIICEKPIADSIENGGLMIAACKESGSLLFVNHFRRFLPFVQKVRRQIVDEQVIGRIQQVRGLYAMGLYEMGTHLVDLFRFFLGEVEWVMGVHNKKAWNQFPGDYCADAILGFQDDVHAVIQSVDRKSWSTFEIQFVGTIGTLTLRDLGRTAEIVLAADSRLYSGFRELDYATRHSESVESESFFTPLLENVIACLDEKAKPASIGEDGVAVLTVLAALRQSAEGNGVRVDL